MLPFTILKIYLWVGMVSLFLIGSTNCMALESSINVRSVVTIVIGVEEHSRCTSKNGGILMA